MAIITLSRQVAAHGDEVAAALAEKLNYKFIKRTEIEDRIIKLGFPESKMPKFDERKPGFFDSMTKNHDQYQNLAQYAMLEAIGGENAIIIGRGAFAFFKDIASNISVRFVADEKTRIERLMKEFDWNEKQARQRIQESDTNRDGFHKNFYTIDVADPANYHMVLNTGLIPEADCATVIANYVNSVITPEKEAEGKKQLENMFKVQKAINKMIFEYKIGIEFLHGAIEGNAVKLYGVASSMALVEQALSVVRNELPEYEAVSAITVVSEYKTYQ
ncbi:MAG: cytidylate kinase-like family protein [Treponema sp.]|nr:cytidylate kinase-like family protein [Treponema sp.]